MPESFFASGGSVYTRLGLGEVINHHSGRRFALGGLGTAVIDRYYLSTLNPAAWSALSFTRIEMGMGFDSYDVQDNSSSALYSDFYFSGFTFGFPVQKDYGISAAFGAVPYTRVNYQVAQRFTGTSISDYTVNYSGIGGITKLFFGGTYELPYGLVFGASYDYYTGKIDYNSELNFDEGTGYSDASTKTTHSFKGMGFTVGLISDDLSSLLPLDKVSQLKLGLSYSQSFPLDTDTTNFAGSPGQLTKTNTGIIEVKIPSRLSVGTSFLWDEDYLVMFDYMLQPWSNYQFDDHYMTNLRDYHKVSLGLEYKNSSRKFRSFWEQIILRGGLSYEQTQYSINANGVDQLSISGGFTIPLGFGNSIDFGLLYGMRGEATNVLMKENILKFSISLSFGDQWFIRRER